MTRAPARLAAFVPFVGIVGLTAMIACSDEATEPTKAPPATTGDTAVLPPATTPLPQGAAELGRFQGRYTAKTKQLTFGPLTQPDNAGAKQPGVGPQGFIKLPSGGLTITTTAALLGPDPTFDGGNGGGCAAGRLCAIVDVTNSDANRAIDSLHVQVSSVSPAGFVGANSAAVPTGYPLSNALGLWSYNSFPVGATGSARWDFTVPDPSIDYTFNIDVYGTFTRTSYGIPTKTLIPNAANKLDNSGTFRNACASPFVQVSGSPFFVNGAAGDDNVANPIALPFPFTFFDLTFDTDQYPFLFISANGALGYNTPGTVGNAPLPDITGTYDYMMFPFGRAITPGANGVCAGVEGTTPNRKFVVTWLDTSLSAGGPENITFSAVLNETSDIVEYQYQRYTTTKTACLQSPATRGQNTTIGLQGPGNLTAIVYGALLDVQTPVCNLTGGMRLLFQPSPGNVNLLARLPFARSAPSQHGVARFAVLGSFRPDAPAPPPRARLRASARLRLPGRA